VAYDAMLEYTVSQDMYLQFNAVNLTDKVYGDQLYPGFYTPGEGRSLKATVGVKF
jgi:catecholate siderophore receptor